VPSGGQRVPPVADFRHSLKILNREDDSDDGDDEIKADEVLPISYPPFAYTAVLN
jgi:hypothetical protein